MQNDRELQKLIHKAHFLDLTSEAKDATLAQALRLSLKYSFVTPLTSMVPPFALFPLSTASA